MYNFKSKRLILFFSFFFKLCSRNKRTPPIHLGQFETSTFLDVSGEVNYQNEEGGLPRREKASGTAVWIRAEGTISAGHREVAASCQPAREWTG